MCVSTELCSFLFYSIHFDIRFLWGSCIPTCVCTSVSKIMRKTAAYIPQNENTVYCVDPTVLFTCYCYCCLLIFYFRHFSRSVSVWFLVEFYYYHVSTLCF